MPDHNYFEAPKSELFTEVKNLGARGPYRAVKFVFKALLPIWGIMILARDGPVIAKLIGAAMIFLTFFPFGKPRRAAELSAEEE